LPWNSEPPLGTARGGLDTARTLDGVIYAIGGFGTSFDPVHDSVERRDPVSGKWTFVEPMSMPRGNPGAAYVEPRVYVVGGNVRGGNSTGEGECFDPSSNKWAPIALHRGTILGPGATAYDGHVYLIGGSQGAASTGSVSVYCPTVDAWSYQRSPMPTPRYLLRAVTLGNYIYAVGGIAGGNQPSFSNALERYDPKTDTWTVLRPMSTSRGNPGVAVADGRIIVVGGAGGVPGHAPMPLSSVEEYDPQADAWTTSEPLPVGRGSLSAERGQGNAVLAIGGFEAAAAGVPPPASKRVESRQF
jgi:N-acetylneuraminic acid mutarotase